MELPKCHQTQQATLNHVINGALKLKYRFQLLTNFLDSLDEVPFKANILDAIILLCAALSDVSATTTNCFCHCGFSLANEPQLTTDNVENEEGEEDEEQGENASDDDNIIVDSNSEEEWVNSDANILTTSELSDAQIIQLAQDEAEDDGTDDDRDDILILQQLKWEWH